MKPEAQPRPRQDAQQPKDAWADPRRKEPWPTRHPRMAAVPACALTRETTRPSTTSENAPAVARGDAFEAWRGCSIEAERRIREPPFMTLWATNR